MNRRLIVLGTDTDAGKTSFSLLWLARFGQAWDYWKPLETGEWDSETVRNCLPDTTIHDSVGRYREAVAPALAAKREGRSIPSAKELADETPAATASRRLLIETFGGPFSPLNETELQLEAVRHWQGQRLLVDSSRVGAVGRSVAVTRALEAASLPAMAIVLMGERDEYAADTIARQTGLPVFTFELPQDRATAAVAASATKQQAELERLHDLLEQPVVREAPNKWLAADAKLIWHPYTSLRPSSSPLTVVAAEAEYLSLADGRQVVDATSSWWTILHGHRHPPLMRALKQASDTLDHVIFAGVTHPPAVEFAERIVKTLPWPDGKVFFSDNGSTAVEVALKMAYQYWLQQGEPQRTLFVGFNDAYHGDTFGAMSVGRDKLFFGPFEPLLFSAAQLPVDPNRLDDYLKQNRDRVASIIIEPLLQAAGGMRTHSPQLLANLFEVTRRHNVLMIADEVMTGNRTGRRWAFDHAAIQPDLICASKTLTGGIMPLAVTLASPKIVASFDTADRAKTFFHGHSFTGHPLACAVAAVNEQLITEPGGLERADFIRDTLMSRLADLREQPNVRDLRSCGSMVAMELNLEGGYLAEGVERWKALALEQGVMLRPLGNVIYALPPLEVSSESLESIALAMRKIAEFTSK